MKPLSAGEGEGGVADALAIRGVAGTVVAAAGRYPPGDLAIWISNLAELPVFAVFKGQMVGDWFMGLHGLRGPWRWVVFTWLVLPGALLATACALSYTS